MKKELQKLTVTLGQMGGEQQIKSCLSTPKFSKEVMMKSSSTIQSSIHQKEKQNFQSVRKFKEDIIKEKNENTLIVKQNVFWPQSENTVRMHTLDDACTISSYNSELSQQNLHDFDVQESVIIMKGSMLKLQLPNSPNFVCERRNFNNKELPFIKLENVQAPALFACPMGFVFHAQLFQDIHYFNTFRAFMLFSDPLLLEIYLCKQLTAKEYIILYQPYEKNLMDYLVKIQEIEEEEILNIINSIGKSIRAVKDESIFPEISIDNFVLVQKVIKLKMSLLQAKTLFRRNNDKLFQSFIQISLQVIDKVYKKIKNCNFLWLKSLKKLLQSFREIKDVPIEHVELQIHLFNKYR